MTTHEAFRRHMDAMDHTLRCYDEMSAVMADAYEAARANDWPLIQRLEERIRELDAAIRAARAEEGLRLKEYLRTLSFSERVAWRLNRWLAGRRAA